MKTTAERGATMRLPGYGAGKAQRPAAGFTAGELVIAVAIVAIVIAVAFPGVAETFRRHRLRTAAWQIAGDLRLARQKSITTGHRHRVCFANCGPQVPTNGYLVQREEAGAWVIEATVQPPATGVQVGSNATVTFAQSGEAAGATVTLTSEGETFQVRTHFTGKVWVCRGSCT
jgi:Tfp pilus assembly protein FimT